MAAENKADLIAITQKEYDKLTTLIAHLDGSDAAQSLNGVSIKDTIGHRAHWIDLFLGWYADGQAGKTVSFPAQGYKWNELKRYNANLRQQQSDLSWLSAKAMLEEQAQRLVDFINSKTDADLYAAPMQGANNTWTTGRWAEAAGASHFRSAARFIRSIIRAASSDQSRASILPKS